jgi:hypothetical protein
MRAKRVRQLRAAGLRPEGRLLSQVDVVHGICHECGRRRRLGRASRTCGACLVELARRTVAKAEKEESA